MCRQRVGCDKARHAAGERGPLKLITAVSQIVWPRHPHSAAPSSGWETLAGGLLSSWHELDVTVMPHEQPMRLNRVELVCALSWTFG